MPRSASPLRPLTSLAYVPVRRCTEGQHEWLDTCALGVSLDQCQENYAATDRLIPEWANMNPVVRIARIILMEDAQ
jgi:hypothetical protein